MILAAVRKFLKENNIKSISPFQKHLHKQSMCLLQNTFCLPITFSRIVDVTKAMMLFPKAIVFLFFLDKQSAATIPGAEHPGEWREWRKKYLIIHCCINTQMSISKTF